MHKVYINNRALIFIDKKELLDDESAQYCITYKSINTIEQAIKQLEEGKKPAIFIHTTNIEATVDEFASLYVPIEAAGGLVRNAENKILLPALHIEDSPRFGWRGMHLDVSRHFFDKDFIKKYIPLIRFEKRINKLYHC